MSDNMIRFALSAEESGLALDQMPDHAVEFSRKQGAYESGSTAPELTPDKVLRIAPVEGGGVSFKVDYELDGVGGHTYESSTGPMEVVAQRGEYVVIRQLILSSIPVLTGWSTLTEAGLQHALHMASNTESRSGGTSGGPYVPPSDVPF